MFKDRRTEFYIYFQDIHTYMPMPISPVNREIEFDHMAHELYVKPFLWTYYLYISRLGPK